MCATGAKGSVMPPAASNHAASPSDAETADDLRHPLPRACELCGDEEALTRVDVQVTKDKQRSLALCAACSGDLREPPPSDDSSE